MEVGPLLGERSHRTRGDGSKLEKGRFGLETGKKLSISGAARLRRSPRAAAAAPWRGVSLLLIVAPGSLKPVAPPGSKVAISPRSDTVLPKKRAFPREGSSASLQPAFFPPNQVAVERLLKMKAQQTPASGTSQRPEGSPRRSPRPEPPPEPGLGLGRPLLQLGGGGGPPASSPPASPTPSLRDMYRELYDFFGDSLATRFGTGLPPAAIPPPSTPEGTRKEPAAAFGGEGVTRKMPQLTANATVSPREEESPRCEPPAARPALHRPASLPRPRGAPRQPGGHRPGAREVFQKCRFAPRGAPRFSFIIAGRQAGRRCQGRMFQTSFPQHHGPGHVSRYAQKLPMIGRTARPARRWPRAEYSLHLLL